jgi:hypothetical protein
VGDIGKHATDLYTKCFIIVDEIEKSQGFRINTFGERVPVNQRFAYTYDSSNELDKSSPEAKASRLLTKSSTITVPNLTQDRINRERAAQVARQKYLSDFGKSNTSNNRIYLPNEQQSIDRARAGDSEMIQLMREMVISNKSMAKEIEVLKSRINSKSQIFKSPKIKNK